MKLIGTILLCLAVFVCGQQNDTTDPTTTTTVTAAPETTTSTTKEPPKTTTEATTTVKPAPAPPVPTPGPSIPDYPHNSGKWSVEDKKNSSCVALKGAIEVIVSTEKQNLTASVPPFAIASGNCERFQQITLSWNSSVLNENKTAFEVNSLTLSFESNSTQESLGASDGISGGKYALQNVTVVLHASSNASSDTPITKTLTNKAVFQTPLNHSFSCHAEEPIKSDSGDFIFKIREIQLEAFRTTPPGHREFSTAEDCAADDNSDLVPIAVGAALAGLVVIVLIAYLIGRKRSRARGYQSV